MSEWISVDDRLPDYETDTLIVSVTTEKPIDRHGTVVFSDTDGFERDQFCYWGRYKGAKVTHWMYLPEPPCAQ